MNSGYLIAGGSILGMGIGFLMNNMLPYMMIGTGCGFLLGYVVKSKQNNDEE